MAIITMTSRIKSAEAAEHHFDLSTFNECPEHHRKPNITLVIWGNRSHQREFIARCPLCPEDKAVFGDLSNNPSLNKWNRFNPNMAFLCRFPPWLQSQITALISKGRDVSITQSLSSAGDAISVDGKPYLSLLPLKLK